MDNKKSIQIILQDIDELREVIAYFNEFGDSIPAIEKDISLQKMRDIYQQLMLLKTGQVSETKPNVIKKSIPQSNPEKNSIEPEVLKTIETTKEPFIEIKEETATAVANIPASGIKSAKKTLADKFDAGKKTLGDNLSAKSNKDISAKLQSKPVGDLLKAIGINDRFTFTKELFGGRQDLFSETIKRLNQMESYTEARSYIEETFSWDHKNETAMAFFDVLKRRFQ